MAKKRKSNVAVGALVAAGIGYAVGILTAPKSGKETRKDLQAKAIKAKAESEKKLKKLHAELDKLISQGKKRASKTTKAASRDLDKVLAKAQTAKEKARGILSALHEGETEDADLQQSISELKQAASHLKKYLNSAT